LAAHPYLEALAKLQRTIDEAGTVGGNGATVAEPKWEAYAADFDKGVPLLHSAAAGFDPAPAAAEALRRIVERLVGTELPETLATEIRTVADRFRASPDAALRTIRALVSPTEGEEVSPAVL